MKLPLLHAGALPAEHHDLRCEVREFLAEELTSGGFTPRCDSWLAGFDAQFSRRLGRRGWIGTTFPKEYGGAGADPTARFVIAEELLAAGAPVAAHWVADRQSGPSILRFGTEAQRERYLPGIARGELFFAIGMSEPDAGSDLASVRTRAQRVDGGWVVTGTKVWTSHAHHAHHMLTLVRTSPADPARRHAGLSQFIVDLAASGVECNPIRLISGAHHFNQVVLTDVFVADDQVLGTIGDGWAQVTHELAYERSGPERILSTYPLLEAARPALSRTAEGRRLIGRLSAELWTLRAMSIAVTAELQAGRAPTVEAAMVKDLGTRFEQDLVHAVAEALTIEPDPEAHGTLAGILAGALLQAPGFTLRGGTNEILRGVVAKAVVGR
ncbi:acyl-CoA dehydrogenase family protein [Streptosporangium sp. NPDC001681]|uniref:acyl-CoA dehydrogenase family protein n=1 Tax=Streptosporangium sp. NPDC001681 TaxID=3154395 RepID=UPI003322C0DE